MIALLLALSAAILFSGASVIFTRFATSHSSIWMNLVKNSVAFIAFSLVTIVLIISGQENWSELQAKSIIYFLLSGFFGLGIGDWFLLKGFQRIGSARAILVFSFQPLLLSIEGFLFFSQEISRNQGIAIFFMTACVWTISYESCERIRSLGMARDSVLRYWSTSRQYRSCTQPQGL